MRSRSISFLNFLEDLGTSFASDKPWRRHDVRRVIWRQVYFTGNQAWRLIAISAFLLSSLVLFHQKAATLGDKTAWAPLFIALFIRELAPLLSLSIVIARSISATASELAAMRAQGEIDALRAAGVSPLSYLVFPRVIGGAFSTFFLSIHFVIVALICSFFFLRSQMDIGAVEYLSTLLSFLSPMDFVLWIFKTFVLSFFAFLLATYCGLSTQGASFEIPQATTRAVMTSLLGGLFAQLGTSLFYYMELWL